MRQTRVGLTNHLVADSPHNERVWAEGTPEPGGDYSLYSLGTGAKDQPLVIRFQKGPVRDVGVNGISTEQLLAVVQHRLECFQNGPYSCRANQIALDGVTTALEALKARTRERIARSVEDRMAK